MDGKFYVCRFRENLTMNIKCCDYSIGRLSIVKLTKHCRFHKNQNEKFQLSTLSNAYGCLKLLTVVYPTYLALLYGGKIQYAERKMRCPSTTNNVVVRVVTFPVNGLGRILMNTAKRYLNFLRPSDYMLFDAGIEIVSVKGNCPMNLKTGDRIRYKYTGTACPAMINSVCTSYGLSKKINMAFCPSDVNLVGARIEK